MDLVVYVGLLAAGTVISAILGFFARKRRSAPGSDVFSLMMAAIFVWCLSSTLEAVVVSTPAKIWCSKLSYFGVVSVAPLWFVFAMRYRGHLQWLSTRNLCLLFALPLAILILALTNEWHGLQWPTISRIPGRTGGPLLYAHGPGVWAVMGYSYILLFAGCLFWIRLALDSLAIYRYQALCLLGSAWLPWFGNIAYLAGWTAPGIDLTPFGLAVAGALLGWSTIRFRLLDLSPVAREALFLNLEDAALVIDARDRIVDLNPAAHTLLGLGPETVGRTVTQALPPNALGDSGEHAMTDPEGGRRWVEFRTSELSDRNGLTSGRLLLGRDVTKRVEAERAREQSIEDLTRALDEIRTLDGLLPICSHCKKIRDDQGYWQQVESYIATRTRAQFSHGICPDCLSTLYPDYVPRPKKRA